MRFLCSGRFQPEGTANFSVCKPPTSYSPPPLPPSLPTWEFICRFSLLLLCPRAVPRDKALCCEHSEAIRTWTFSRAKSGLSSKESDRRGTDPPLPPAPVDLPLPGVNVKPQCAWDARASTPGSADGAGEQSPSLPCPAPPHRSRSLAGLKRKQMFSSFLDPACDLQFSSVPTEPRDVRSLHPPQNKNPYLNEPSS